MFCSAVKLGVMTCCWSLFCLTEPRRSPGCYIPSCRTLDISIQPYSHRAIQPYTITRLTNTNNTAKTPTALSGLHHYCVITNHHLQAQYTLTLPSSSKLTVWLNSKNGCFLNPPTSNGYATEERGITAVLHQASFLHLKSHFHFSCICMPCGWWMEGWWEDKHIFKKEPQHDDISHS